MKKLILITTAMIFTSMSAHAFCPIAARKEAEATRRRVAALVGSEKPAKPAKPSVRGKSADRIGNG